MHLARVKILAKFGRNVACEFVNTTRRAAKKLVNLSKTANLAILAKTVNVGKVAILAKFRQGC